jgi:oxygen-dependent protoporphyrinogen oxidase
MSRVVIIGGGISGLATAFFLQQLQPSASIDIAEKEPRLGGTMHSVERNEFLFEAGSNGFLSNREDTLALVRLIGAEALLQESSESARKRFLYTDRLHRLPENPAAFVRSELLGWRDKLRVLGEVLVPANAAAGDESLQSFGYRRVGKAFTDTFLDALAAGIHASTPAKLSVSAAFPVVAQLEREFGGLFKGMIKKRRRRAGPGGTLMSFHGGMSTLVERLRAVLTASVHLDTEITTLAPTTTGYRVQGTGVTLEASRVVLATPAYVAAALLRSVDATLAEELSAIEYSPVAVVGFGFEALPYPLDGFGLLTTTASRRNILGVLWDSSIFAGRAPAGSQSVRVLIGGQRQPQLVARDDETLTAIALEGIRETMGIEPQPVVSYVKRWERGIPHYALGHQARLARIAEALREHPHLYLNSNAYRGVGVNDCIVSSKRCAKELIAAA